MYAKYNVEILWDDEEEEWWVLLYNFYTHEWEQKYWTSDNSVDDDGYDVGEEWHFTDDDHSPQLMTIRSKDLQVYIADGSPDWHDVTSTYGQPRVEIEDDPESPYNWNFLDEYYYWKVIG